jgi:hypothetical protein
MLVVVRALAAVVPQVERGLHGLGVQRALGVVLCRTPLGVHLVHGSSLLDESGNVLDLGMTPEEMNRLGCPRIAWVEGFGSSGWNFVVSLAEG